MDTSERTRKNLMLSENCSYGRNELAMLKMGHEGLFGDITNGHGGYLHDLRALLFSNTYYTDSWRHGTPAPPRPSTPCTAWPRSRQPWTSTAATA